MCFVKVLFSIIWVTYLALLGVFVKQPDMANPHDFYRGISPPRFSESSQRFHQLDRSEEKWHGLAGISAGFSIACFFCLLLFLLWLFLYLCLCLRVQCWDEYEIMPGQFEEPAWDQTCAKHIYPTCRRRIYLVLFLFFNLQMQCRPVYKSKQ